MYETEIQCNPNNLLTENQCVHVQAAKGLVNSLHAQFFKIIFCLLILIKINFFKKISGLSSGCQTVWIQIRPDKMSGLIWVQTVCKDQRTTVTADKEFRNLTRLGHQKPLW